MHFSMSRFSRRLNCQNEYVLTPIRLRRAPGSAAEASPATPRRPHPTASAPAPAETLAKKRRRATKLSLASCKIEFFIGSTRGKSQSAAGIRAPEAIHPSESRTTAQAKLRHEENRPPANHRCRHRRKGRSRKGRDRRRHSGRSKKRRRHRRLKTCDRR